MKYRLSENFVIRNILDECIIVNNKSSGDEEHGFFALNPTGKIIINGIRDGRDTDDIAGEICDRFDIDSACAMADTEEFISQFKEMGIILDIQ